MAKQHSPFAGIKLTDQTPVRAGPDQRLFTPSEPRTPQPPRKQGTKEATLQPRKVESLEPRNLESKEPPRESSDDKPLFDLTEPPYRNDTFAFTDAELDAIEDMKLELRRKHDIRATKNNLIRCALHLLVEDYKRHGAQSNAARRLRRTRT